MADLTPEQIQALVASGAMEPRVGEMFLQKYGNTLPPSGPPQPGASPMAFEDQRPPAPLPEPNGPPVAGYATVPFEDQRVTRAATPAAMAPTGAPSTAYPSGVDQRAAARPSMADYEKKRDEYVDSIMADLGDV